MFDKLTKDEAYALHSKLFSGQTKAFAVMDNLTAWGPAYDAHKGVFTDLSDAMRDVAPRARSQQ